MIRQTFSKIFLVLGATSLLLSCSGSSNSASTLAANPPNASQNACQAFAVPCSETHGAGTQSCTDSVSGPVYGDCENIVCDPGFNLNPDGICVAGENVKTFSMLVTGPGLAPQGVSSFIALIGETYDFKIAGSQDVQNSGLNTAQSYAKYISGQCPGIGYVYQPVTTNFTATGPTPQFGDNMVTYTPTIADTLGGCIWQVCAISNDTSVHPACVNLIASINPIATPTTTTTVPVTTTIPAPTTTLPAPTTTLPPVTTTLPAPTTTLPPVTTTLPSPTTTLPPVTTTTSTTLPHPTTTTTTLPPTTTTTSTTTTSTLPHPTTTTTTLPPTTTTTSTTTTTTLPHEVPKVSGTVCVGAGSGQYNCEPLASSGTGANKLKHDVGCTTNVTISYKGKTASTSLFGTSAPYYSNGNGSAPVVSTTLPLQGVNFMIYMRDQYSVSGMGNWLGCSVLISWPNFPNGP